MGAQDPTTKGSRATEMRGGGGGGWWDAMRMHCDGQGWTGEGIPLTWSVHRSSQSAARLTPLGPWAVDAAADLTAAAGGGPCYLQAWHCKARGRDSVISVYRSIPAGRGRGGAGALYSEACADVPGLLFDLPIV